MLAAGFVLFHPVPSAWMTAYRHDVPGTATIVVAGAPRAAFALSGDAVPAVFDPSSVNHAVLRSAWTQPLPAERSLTGLNGAFRLNFREDQSSAAAEQNHLVVFYPLGCIWLPARIVTAIQNVGLCHGAGYIEIVRQSPEFLRAQYNFDKPDGYSIAGRRTIELPQADEERSAKIVDGNPVPLQLLPQLAPEIAARIGDGHAELKQAARLIAFMNEQPVRIGPVKDAPHADATARLAAIRAGESAVQCQGFRDIWLELAVRVPGIERVRSVSAYNYFPPFEDLVTFSHALAELYVSDERRWILIDPWFGFSLRYAGRFLGVADLAALRQDEKAAIEVVPLVDRVRRFTIAAGGARRPSASSVAEIAPPMRSRFVKGRYQLGYLEYFASIAYGASIGGAGRPLPVPASGCEPGGRHRNRPCRRARRDGMAGSAGRRPR